MPSGTTNYGFVKPAALENYDVAVVNANSDAIDTAIKARADAIASVETELNTRFPDGASAGVLPRCKMQQTGVQTTATGVSEVLLLTGAATTYDTDTMTSAKASNVLTIKHAGWYIIACRVLWTANAVGDRGIYIRKNGAIIWEDRKVATGNSTVVPHTLVCEPTQFAVNDTIDVLIYQNSGGTLTTTNGAVPGYPSISVTMIPQ
jgi:hypothetical protein